MQYIGSFVVVDPDSSSSTPPIGDFVNQQLERLTAADSSRRVLLVVSLAGLKMCSQDGRVSDRANFDISFPSRSEHNGKLDPARSL